MCDDGCWCWCWCWGRKSRGNATFLYLTLPRVDCSASTVFADFSLVHDTASQCRVRLLWTYGAVYTGGRWTALAPGRLFARRRRAGERMPTTCSQMFGPSCGLLSMGSDECLSGSDALFWWTVFPSRRGKLMMCLLYRQGCNRAWAVASSPVPCTTRCRNEGDFAAR